MAAVAADKKSRFAGAETLAARVAAIDWYHTIELPNGVVTDGAHDHRGIVSRYGLPADLSGRRVLDVATFDGFWAFEFERRGASVVAIDLPSTTGLDLPPSAKEIVRNEGWDAPMGQGFQTAAEALGSRVERRVISVYDLDPSTVGTFDFVYSGDLLLHLAAPMVALQRMRSVATGDAVIVDCYDPDVHGPSVRYYGGWQGLHWWAPSLETLVQWVHDAGFRDVRVHDAFQVRNARTPSEGFWRAVIHAKV